MLVNTLDDELNGDGDCSLREAIEAANTNTAVDVCPAGDAVITDTISFDVAGMITVTSQLSVLAGGPLVIDGGEAITVSGGDSVRVFYVGVGAQLTLENMVVVDGFVPYVYGGGIYNEGTLTITGSTFSGNRSADMYGGGIYNDGTLTITDSTSLATALFMVVGSGTGTPDHQQQHLLRQQR
jgi:CSLREA domain-containing protein